MKAGFAYGAAWFGFVLLLAGAARADFEDGMAYFSRGDIGPALGEFMQSAADDDPRGQHALAMMYLRGKGVSQDAVTAMGWFQKAADRGHVSAMLQIGKLLQAGTAVEGDLVAAHRWYAIAAAHGHPAGEKMRDTLTAELEEDQLAQSRSETDSWMQAHYGDVAVDKRASFLEELKRLREVSASGGNAQRR